MKSELLALAHSVTDTLFPPRCVHCGAAGALFCAQCEKQSPRLDPAACCRRCGLPSRSATCEPCFLNPPALDRVYAVFQYDGPLSDAVQALKYDDIRALAPRLAELMHEQVYGPRTDVDFLVPAPMHSSRMRSRGYNQSELLARHIGRATGAVVDTRLLKRVHNTAPQARALSEQQRKRNVAGAFEASDEVSGRRLLLVDDVMTTGATLNACGQALKSKGASWVGALVLAREL